MINERLVTTKRMKKNICVKGNDKTTIEFRRTKMVGFEKGLGDEIDVGPSVALMAPI